MIRGATGRMSPQRVARAGVFRHPAAEPIRQPPPSARPAFRKGGKHDADLQQTPCEADGGRCGGRMGGVGSSLVWD